MTFVQTHRTGYECAKDYYARDLKGLDLDSEPRCHFCFACGSTDYTEFGEVEDPKVFVCPGHDGQCHCLYRFVKLDGRFARRYFCSQECALEAVRAGKRVWYDDSGKRHRWDTD